MENMPVAMLTLPGMVLLQILTCVVGQPGALENSVECNEVMR
jgi:hypothetical protein